MIRALATASLTAALLLGGNAHAIEYTQVDTAASTLGFRYTQMGVTLDGRFRQFTATLAYDPTRPDAARTVFEVPIAGIDTGAEEGNAEVKGKDWFNLAAHPLARFESTAVTVRAPNRLDVTGTLTIKGRSRTVTLPVEVDTSAQRVRFKGSLALRRADYAIGEGDWAAEDIVAGNVQVDVVLVATPAGKP
ncbi:MAG: YceI family protein [Rhodocyclaceae bacterium]|nr:YceI family protein [Rhodocyclaceae bacterium]